MNKSDEMKDICASGERLTAGVHDIGSHILRGDLRRDCNLWDDVLDLGYLLSTAFCIARILAYLRNEGFLDKRRDDCALANTLYN